MFEACTVRALTVNDLPMVLAWRNHPDVRGYMLTQHTISLEEHRCWFARVQGDESRRQLIVSENGSPFGFVQLSSVSWGGVADWGFYIRPDAPKGSGRKMGHVTLNYAFHELGLHKVCGQAIESNAVSIAFHQKLGFIEEGRLREQKRIEGNYHTLICFGLLAKAWHLDQRTEAK